MKNVLFLLSIFLLLTTVNAQAPAKHRLTVSDLTGKPLTDVAVTVGDQVIARTDQNGYVEIVNPCTGIMSNLNYSLSLPGYRFEALGFLGGLLGTINCYASNQHSLDVRGTTLPRAFVVSAADYRPRLTPDMLVSIFGQNLAASTVPAASLPLPTTLAGRRVKVVDFHDGGRREHFAQLLFVSPMQINLLLPVGLTTQGWITVTGDNGEFAMTFFATPPDPIAAGFFTLNGTGRGLVAGVVLRISADGAQRYEALGRYNAEAKRWEPIPIDLGAATDRIFLALFGTGIRNRRFSHALPASIGGMIVYSTFSGPQGSMPGLDQVNIPLPRALAGRGEVNLYVDFESGPTNTVNIVIK